MAALSKNVEEMLIRLAENARTEQDFVLTLSDAIRRVDEQLLRDVRNVALQHELRREAILGELQDLASRLCALPARTQNQPVAAIDQQHQHQHQQQVNQTRAELEALNGQAGDWRQAAQNMHDEFEFTFNGQQRH
ncbi:hypothetical protein [Hyphomicrobium sp.]|uniref:hypothetical protein n=1 Tax=Hyphomicrobium sp. TaxID=82 RepID=UPI002D7A1C03|nr:hypothetical protein [Hyphomicrobium sp.]HET6388056.1 hypothetical protein [Hyphomicrobium sp.]